MRFCNYSFLYCVSFVFALIIISPVQAQQSSSTSSDKPKLNLFLDCNHCNSQYLKENVNIVNYVRDKEDAQIHLLVTRAQTGSGGTEYTLSFIGEKEFEGMDNELVYVASESNTQEETRSGLANRIRVGLVPYVSQTHKIDQIGVTFKEEKGANKKNRDKWNKWIFEIGARANIRGEEQQSSLELQGDLSADHVTKDLKVELEAEGSFEREQFTLGDRDTSFTQNRQRFDGLLVKSLTPNWSVGASAEVFSSTFRNIEFQASASPAIEYNIYPYREYNEHELSFLYEISPTYNSYRDTTIFRETEEFLIEQSLEINYEVTKTWGSARTTLEASNFLYDFSKNRLNLNGHLNFRVFRGLSLNIFGNYSLINDQIAIPARGITDEEALLRLRDRVTGFEYFVGFGLTYTFGSIFNNVVNPRF